jgi:hypothetical protein
MKRCPPEIAEIIVELIETALLRIRARGWAGNSARCAVEADHVHNLPRLLSDFSPERLRYYWEMERPAFSREVGEEDGGFHDLWERLSVYVAATATTSAHGAALLPPG